MTTPTPSEIIKGEKTFTMEDFYEYIKGFSPDNKTFHPLFLFILLSSEDKSAETMINVFRLTKEQISECQEVFREEIDVCRAIHMKKYLDIFSEYLGTTSINLQILNLWIKDFLKTHIKEEENVAA